MEYHLGNTSLDWATLFRTMNLIKHQFKEVLEDYTINETTLEEVFISLARNQYPARQVQISLFKKLFNCRKS